VDEWRAILHARWAPVHDGTCHAFYPVCCCQLVTLHTRGLPGSSPEPFLVHNVMSEMSTLSLMARACSLPKPS